MHADRTNRVVLTLFALLLLGAGIAGLLASIGRFGTGFAHTTLFDNRFCRYVGDQGSWLWATAAVAAALIAVLALLWLYTLLTSTDRAGDIAVAAQPATGRTTLRPGALAIAVADEIESYHGVQTVRARVLGDPSRPQLVIRATLMASADLAALRQRIDTGALAHARHALQMPDLPIQLDLDITREKPTRVI
jgi:hypothetical protein